MSKGIIARRERSQRIREAGEEQRIPCDICSASGQSCIVAKDISDKCRVCVGSGKTCSLSVKTVANVDVTTQLSPEHAKALKTFFTHASRMKHHYEKIEVSDRVGNARRLVVDALEEAERALPGVFKNLCS